jgi:hypothetical protein
MFAAPKHQGKMIIAPIDLCLIKASEVAVHSMFVRTVPFFRWKERERKYCMYFPVWR